MTRFVALLGGINVTGRRVKMDHLRRLFEQLGFLNVDTFIASGNVIFHSQEHDERVVRDMVERHLEVELGFSVPAFFRTIEELTVIAGTWPFLEPPADQHTLSIMFMDEPLSEAAKHALVAYHTPVDAFGVHEREILWLCRTKTTNSLVNWTQLGKSVSLPRMTVRNVTTIRKLVAKYMEDQ